MGHKFRFIALLLVALTIVPLFAVPASAAYSYPMSLTIYYKDEAGNTLKSPYTGSFNAADHEGLKWYAPRISGYALKNDSDATITYEMLDKSFPASNYLFYRKWKREATEEQREELLDKIYNGDVTALDIDALTDKLGKDVGMVYGWEFPNTEMSPLPRQQKVR